MEQIPAGCSHIAGAKLEKGILYNVNGHDGPEQIEAVEGPCTRTLHQMRYSDGRTGKEQSRPQFA